MPKLRNKRKIAKQIIAMEVENEPKDLQNPTSAETVDAQLKMKELDLKRKEMELREKQIESEERIKIVEIKLQSEERMKALEIKFELDRLSLERENLNTSPVIVQRATCLEMEYDRKLDGWAKILKSIAPKIPSDPGNFPVYFQALENIFECHSIPKAFQGQLVQPLLGEKITNLIIRLEPKQLNDYDILKSELLKEFKLTPQEYLRRFNFAKKHFNETYPQFSARLRSLWTHYEKSRKVNTHEELIDLIISDKLRSSLPTDTRDYINLMEGESWFKDSEMASLAEIHSTTQFKSEEKRFSRNEHTYRPPQQRDSFRKDFTNKNVKFAKECFGCGKFDHVIRNCPNRINHIKGEERDKRPTTSVPKNKTRDHLITAKISSNCFGNVSESSSNIEFRPPFTELQTVKVKILGKEVIATLDSGAQIPVIAMEHVPKEYLGKQGTVCLKSAFSETLDCDLVTIPVSATVENFNLRPPVQILAAVTDKLCCSFLIPPDIYKLLLTEIEPYDCNPKRYPMDTSEELEEVQNSSDETQHISLVEEENLENQVALVDSHKIRLKENVERKKPYVYRIPETLKKEVDEQIEELQALGLIECSDAEIAHPVVCVSKRDGGMRLCIDFRSLNSATKAVDFPMENSSDLIVHIGRSNVITCLDILKGYWEIPLEKESRELTSFKTHKGQYQWKVMPFGLRNAAATFQRVVNKALAPFSDFARAYIDDIAVFSDTWEQHLKCLDKVFGKLRELKFTVNLAKCIFAQGKVKYLGHIIGSGTQEPDPEKLTAIQELLRPKTKTKLRSFLGLCNYYREYISHYAEIAYPLTELTKKKVPENIPWTDTEQRAFEDLKEKLCCTSALHTPMFGKPYTMHTDASAIGIGVCLSQRGNKDKLLPVGFASQKLSHAQQSWPAIEREAYAIVWGLKKFENWLFGSSIELVTDHNPLTYITKCAPQSSKLQRWALALQKYDISVTHCPGTLLKNADGLSRLFTVMEN